MRARLAVLAVAGLIAVLGVTAITASGTGHETEVRITAALAADGRIEFALQQREADEGWSGAAAAAGTVLPGHDCGRALAGEHAAHGARAGRRRRCRGRRGAHHGATPRRRSHRVRAAGARGGRGMGRAAANAGAILPRHGHGRALAVEHAADGEPAGHGRRRERGVGPGGAGRPLQRHRWSELEAQRRLAE